MSLLLTTIIEKITKLADTKQKEIIKIINGFLETEEKEQKETELKVIELKKNQQKKEGVICPHCSSREIIGFGEYRDRKRYRCKKCSKTFNDMTGTPLSGTHYMDKWQQYFEHMANGDILSKTAESLDINIKTSFHWRHKILNGFRNANCDKLEGIVESDEVFFLYSEKGKKKKITPSRKRGGVARKRGLSNEQVCVLTACNRENLLVGEVAGTGKISTKEIENVFGDTIKKGSVLCTDENSSYREYAANHDLTHETVNISKKQRIKNKIYHIQTINSYHSRFKNWMERFHGVASKYLSNYFNWFKVLETTKKEDNQIYQMINCSVAKDSIFSIGQITKGYTQFLGK